jgi:hypothetical protein
MTVSPKVSEPGAAKVARDVGLPGAIGMQVVRTLAHLPMPLKKVIHHGQVSAQETRLTRGRHVWKIGLDAQRRILRVDNLNLCVSLQLGATVWRLRNAGRAVLCRSC